MVQTKLPSVYDDVFSLSPIPLQAACLGKITQELPNLTACEVRVSEGDGYPTTSMRFVQDVRIPDKIAEKMLEDFSMNRLISNETLTLFSDVSKHNLKVLRLSDIDMTKAGRTLLEYSKHTFREISLGCNTPINRWSIRKLIDSFAGSRFSLTVLKLDLYPAVNIAAGTVFDFFVQFPNLRTLEYNTPVIGNNETFTNKNWDNLLTSCASLRVLRISINGSPKDIELDSEIFLKGQHLQSLSLFSALKSQLTVETFNCVKYFTELDNLRELDLSIDLDPPDMNLVNLNNFEQLLKSHIHQLAAHVDRFLELSNGKLKLLESLDLSGIYNIEDMKLQGFIEAHENLRFLGLCMLRSKFCVNGDAVAYYPHLKVCHPLPIRI